ncbi:hypothetical protein BH24ACI5_BH24ACI5_28380 [soil metagenome]
MIAAIISCHPPGQPDRQGSPEHPLAHGDADALAHLAYCEIKLGRLSDAREHVRAVLAVNPEDALARQLAAYLAR